MATSESSVSTDVQDKLPCERDHQQQTRSQAESTQPIIYVNCPRCGRMMKPEHAGQLCGVCIW